MRDEIILDISSSSSAMLQLKKWIFEMIKTYIHGRTLEIDGGETSLCPLFMDHNLPIHLTSRDQLVLRTLRDRYKDNDNVRAIHSFDFIAGDFQTRYPETRGVFDTVIGIKFSIRHISSYDRHCRERRYI